MGLIPSLQLFSAQKLWRTCVLTCSVSLNTTPAPCAPPYGVVPYRFPPWSRTTPTLGSSPSGQLVWVQKLCRTVSLPSEVSLNTTPQPRGGPLHMLDTPPNEAVPYRFPCWSKTSPASGIRPVGAVLAPLRTEGVKHTFGLGPRRAQEKAKKQNHQHGSALLRRQCFAQHNFPRTGDSLRRLSVLLHLKFSAATAHPLPFLRARLHGLILNTTPHVKASPSSAQMLFWTPPVEVVP